MFSGKCGENATWEYDPDTCKLTISGTGAMYDYNWDANSNYPRKDYAEKITSAEIEDGITYIGTRHGEKVYETLVTQEEMLKSVDLGNFFCVKADNRDLNYDKYFTKGNKKLNIGESYTSHNTARLDVKGMEELLKKLELFGGPVRQHD